MNKQGSVPINLCLWAIITSLVVLGLRCCVQAFSSRNGWGSLLFVVVQGHLIVVASPVAEHRF